MKEQMDSNSKHFLSRKDKRKLKDFKKKTSEFLLLSKSDPSDGVTAVSDSEKTASSQYGKDISMKISRKLRSVKKAVAPIPKIWISHEKLNGIPVGNRQIAALIHYLTLSHVPKPLWVQIKPHKGLLQSVLIRVESDIEIMDKMEEQEFVSRLFREKPLLLSKNVFERDSFFKAMFNVPLTRIEQLKEINSRSQTLHDKSTSFKTNLLMSLDQMIDLQYPFPDNKSVSSLSLHTAATKEKYAPVSEESPMFAIDCEMCLTGAGKHELTRISLVDEDYNVLIDTLVKPFEPISDYLTKFSGITKELLDPVDIRLTDVQLALKHILPADAILVGHSLEFDLRALNLAHPYCIDIGYALNLSGSEKHRSSLKTLVQIFLGKSIQEYGHCSVVDAVAAMELVKLKFRKGFAFGNVLYGWNYDHWAAAHGLSSSGGVLRSEKRQRLEEGSKQKNINSEDFILTRRYCESCKRALTVLCFISRCMCLKQEKALCVICCLMSKPPVASSVVGTFDWSASFAVDDQRRTRPLCWHLSNTRTRSMIAFLAEGVEGREHSKWSQFLTTSAFEDINVLANEVSYRILEHHLVLVEIKKSLYSSDSDDCSSVSRLVDGLEKIILGAARNSLIMLLLTAPRRSLLFTTVKDLSLASVPFVEN